MHEWALAEGVFTTALEAAEQANLKSIRRIEVLVGELQQIEEEIFSFALQEVIPAQEPRLAGTEIEVRIEPASFRCRACGAEASFAELTSELTEEEREAIHFIPELAHSYLACRGCGSPDFEVLTGRGVSIGAVEGE